jgi:phosphopantetheine--protein transferase-like protein
VTLEHMGGVNGIGIDVVDVPRFRELLERRPSIVDRVFTPRERAYAAKMADPAQHLAARFAAKEAVLKALSVGIGAADFHEVEVVRDDGGAPRLHLAGRAAVLAERRGVDTWHLSLTHTRKVAMASVIAEHGT